MAHRLKNAHHVLYRTADSSRTWYISGRGFTNTPNRITAVIDDEGDTTLWDADVEYVSAILIKLRITLHPGFRVGNGPNETGQVDVVITNGDANQTETVLPDVPVIYLDA